MISKTHMIHHSEALASTHPPPEDPQVNLEIGPAADSGGTGTLVDTMITCDHIKVAKCFDV